jgi:hypothetical protein
MDIGPRSCRVTIDIVELLPGYCHLKAWLCRDFGGDRVGQCLLQNGKVISQVLELECDVGLRVFSFAAIQNFFDEVLQTVVATCHLGFGLFKDIFQGFDEDVRHIGSPFDVASNLRKRSASVTGYDLMIAG